MVCSYSSLCLPQTITADPDVHQTPPHIPTSHSANCARLFLHSSAPRGPPRGRVTSWGLTFQNPSCRKPSIPRCHTLRQAGLFLTTFALTLARAMSSKNGWLTSHTPMMPRDGLTVCVCACALTGRRMSPSRRKLLSGDSSGISPEKEGTHVCGSMPPPPLQTLGHAQQRPPAKQLQGPPSPGH